ncbi:MAG: nuclear transport factor 2 family protein [Herminiimonas sp.]|nr:nuclear transport factor 2 family protein [Herminiimonas sp.]
MPKINRLFASPEATENAFYDAIARADLDALMTLWADEDEIVCIHPGAARLVGRAAIRASWEAIFERGGVHIHPTQRHVVMSSMSAVHNLIEEIRHGDQEPTQRHVLATNIYLKTPAGWRIVVHHASVAPGAAPVDTAPSSTLH